jgi:hypothetical protein
LRTSSGKMSGSSNMALQRTRRPRIRSGRSLRSLGSPLNARPLGRRALIDAASAVLLLSAATFGSIVTRPAEQPSRNTRAIREDATYEFVFRHYGSSGDPGGNTVPGLFVRSKETGRWLEVMAVSTKGGKFGKSWSDDPEERKRLEGISVSWNFTGLGSEAFAQLPLRTSGSIAFPDQIEDDKEGNQYRFRFMSALGIASAETVLLVDKADLKAAFDASSGRAK